MMYLASGSTAVIIWIALLVVMSLINSNKRRKKAQESGHEESWGTTLLEAMKEASRELTHEEKNPKEELQSEREIVQDKQYDRAYEEGRKSMADRDNRAGKRLTENDRNGDEDASEHQSAGRRIIRQKPRKGCQHAYSCDREVEGRPFSEEYASLSEMTNTQNSPIYGPAASSAVNGQHHTAAANFSRKTGRKQEETIQDEISKSEICEENNRAISEEFDIRKAVIFSEIIRPKFDQEKD